MRTAIAAFLLGSSILLAGCGRGGKETMGAPASAADAPVEAPERLAPPPAAAPDTSPARRGPLPFQGTAGITYRPPRGVGVATLRAVRTAFHDGYDRVVFEFEGERLPGYHIEYIDRPVRQCASGEVVPLAGDAWLRVRMEPAQAHTEAGEPTIAERALTPGLPNLKELKLTCDFEAQVEWVLGLASPNPYRVLELSGPPRLVVDVRH